MGEAAEPFCLAGGQRVAARFADGGQDFRRDPLAEAFGFGFSAGENEGVEAAFVDDGGVRIAAITLTNV